MNNWTSVEFAKYVGGRVPIERDHGGIGQGYEYDDGYISYAEDSKCFNIVHVDPWKIFSDFDDGLKETINNIEFIYDSLCNMAN